MLVRKYCGGTEESLAFDERTQFVVDKATLRDLKAPHYSLDNWEDAYVFFERQPLH